MSVVKVYCKIETSPWALTQLIGGGKEEKKQWTMFLFAFKYDTAPVADPDLELRGGGGVGGVWDVETKLICEYRLPCRLFFLLRFFIILFFAKIRGYRVPRAPPLDPPLGTKRRKSGHRFEISIKQSALSSEPGQFSKTRDFLSGQKWAHL